jgi:hypothetical protein
MVPEPPEGKASPCRPNGPQGLLRDSLVRFDGGSLPTLGERETTLSDSPTESGGPILLSGRRQSRPPHGPADGPRNALGCSLVPSYAPPRGPHGLREPQGRGWGADGTRNRPP